MFAGGLFGFTTVLPYTAVLALSVLVGLIVQDNLSNLTSGLLAVAVPQYRGATIGLYSCIGLGAGPSERSCSASGSANSAERRSPPPGSQALAPAALRA